MSRSFKKKPFMAITGAKSAKVDKQLAHRGERRKHSLELRMAGKEARFDDYVPPLRRECRWNNNYCWSRDGKQHYMVPSARDYGTYCLSQLPGYEYLQDRSGVWPPPWFDEIIRK